MNDKHRTDRPGEPDPRSADAPLEANVRATFDASVERLDATTRSRLARARAAAVDAAATPRSRFRNFLGIPQLGAAAAAAAVALAIVWLPGDPGAPDAPDAGLTAFEDLDILMNDEELDLFEELEFFAWLDEQAAIDDTAVDADGSG